MWSAQGHQAALLTCESEQIVKALPIYIVDVMRLNSLLAKGKHGPYYSELILVSVK